MGPVAPYIGGAVAGAMLSNGKDGGGSGPTSNPAADAQSRIAEALWNETSPLRKLFLDRGNAFLTGGLDVTQSPMFGNLKNAVETQFGRAKQNVLETSPVGGGLTSALAALEAQKASTMTSGISGIAEGELSRAFGMASGAPGQALAGLGSAASIQGALASANAARAASAKQGMGQGLGMLAYSAITRTPRAA